MGWRSGLAGLEAELGVGRGVGVQPKRLEVGSLRGGVRGGTGRRGRRTCRRVEAPLGAFLARAAGERHSFCAICK